jgi:hypothetical protein
VHGEDRGLSKGRLSNGQKGLKRRKKEGWMKRYVFAGLVLLEAVLAVAWAASLRPLTEQERAFYGATHEVEFTYADLTETNTNTAQQLTFNVYSNTAVRGVCLVVDEAFVGPTNNHFTLSLTVGDEGDTDRYFDATELSSAATNVWVKWPRSTWNTGQSTNVTLAYGEYVFTTTSTTGLQFTVTPNAENAVSEATAGKVRVLLRMFGF